MHDSLLTVEKPARYLGGEAGSAPRTDGLRFVLAFPDVYEVGMSHLGLQVLYGVLKEVPWVAPERVYAPWPDREEALRGAGEPLRALESELPVADADIVGFTLQYELSYTNILNILDLAGIPLLAAERSGKEPVIIGGGPCACNPEPLADFFDAFLIGDGEEAIVEIAAAVREWKTAGTPRAALLERLAGIAGVYVPSFFRVSYGDHGKVAAIVPLKEGYSGVRRRILPDLDTAPYPVSPVVPLMKTVHDRVSMEIGRGCTRGCRFCQAGYIYRPVRERSPETVLRLVEETLARTGYDEISLLSLSAGDYACIQPLLRELMVRHAASRTAVSFPSMRVGTLTPEMIEEVKKVRKTGFTLAPEAGTERLRRVINKGISEEELVATAGDVYGAGWRLIKLYFMTGLPTETRDDLLAICDLARRVKQQGRRCGGGEVNVAVSTFVPKAHTPFQWEAQISYEDTLERQELLREELRRRKLVFKWQDAPLSVMEGVFARGDRRLSEVLLKAHELGCRFDGWGEKFSFPRWIRAFEACGIDPRFYLRRREKDEILPWQHLDMGVDAAFLAVEREKALAEGGTPDCRTAGCTGCGVCDFREVRLRLHAAGTPVPHREEAAAAADIPAKRIRLRYAKKGRMRLLSHLETINVFSRAVRRASIPIRYSQGFHPHPRFSFGDPMPVGTESSAEYLDMEIDAVIEAEEAARRLDAALPEGFAVMEGCDLAPGTPSITASTAASRYRALLPERLTPTLPALAEAFLARESFPLCREKKKGVQELDLRAELVSLQVAGNVVELTVRRGKPLEYLCALTGESAAALGAVRIEKIEVLFGE